MKKSTLMFPLAILMVIVIACTCGKLDNKNNSNSNNSNSSESRNSNRSENDDSSNENKTTSTTKTASTGIPECDAYMQMIEDYLNCKNVPEASREQWKKQRDETIQKIREAAKTETGKQFMANFCKQVTETAKDQLKCD